MEEEQAIELATEENQDMLEVQELKPRAQQAREAAESVRAQQAREVVVQQRLQQAQDTAGPPRPQQAWKAAVLPRSQQTQGAMNQSFFPAWQHHPFQTYWASPTAMSPWMAIPPDHCFPYFPFYCATVRIHNLQRKGTGRKPHCQNCPKRVLKLGR